MSCLSWSTIFPIYPEYFRSKMSKFLRPPSAVFRFCIITHVRQLCINFVDSPKKAKSHASLAVAIFSIQSFSGFFCSG